MPDGAVRDRPWRDLAGPTYEPHARGRQLRPARLAAQMVLDHVSTVAFFLLGQRVDQQLLPPPEPPDHQPPSHTSERQDWTMG